MLHHLHEDCVRGNRKRTKVIAQKLGEHLDSILQLHRQIDTSVKLGGNKWNRVKVFRPIYGK